MIMRRPYSRTPTRRDHAAEGARNAQVTAPEVKEQAKCLFLNPAGCDLRVATAGWNVSGAPGSDGGDETNQPHQEPWCQSALPRWPAHAPARVAAARVSTPRIPPMPNGR